MRQNEKAKVKKPRKRPALSMALTVLLLFPFLLPGSGRDVSADPLDSDSWHRFTSGVDPALHGYPFARARFLETADDYIFYSEVEGRLYHSKKTNPAWQPLCSLAGCDHQNEFCQALLPSPASVYRQGEELWIFQGRVLWKQSLEGSERELVLDLSLGDAVEQTFYVHDGWVYVLASSASDSAEQLDSALGELQASAVFRVRPASFFVPPQLLIGDLLQEGKIGHALSFWGTSVYLTEKDLTNGAVTHYRFEDGTLLPLPDGLPARATSWISLNGRFYAYDAGAGLYSLEKDGTLTRLWEGLHTPVYPEPFFDPLWLVLVPFVEGEDESGAAILFIDYAADNRIAIALPEGYTPTLQASSVEHFFFVLAGESAEQGLGDLPTHYLLREEIERGEAVWYPIG